MAMKPRIENGFWIVAKPSKLRLKYPKGDVSCTLITPERRST
jgi:hypothetical protein